MADFPATITELGDKIANLKLSEAAALKEYLKEKYKIEPAAGGGGMMMAAPAAAAAAPVAEVKTEFTVVLEGLADASKKIQVIKVVRELTSLGLKEAKDLVDGAPKPVLEKVSKEDAEKGKAKLEESGAQVEMK